MFRFRTRRGSVQEVLTDHDLASLGDAYVNFLCSVALSNRTGKPQGVKVKGSVLSEALRKAGLRDCLGSRMSRHVLADAAEALLVYAWLNRSVTLDDGVTTLEKSENLTDGLSTLLKKAKEKIIFL